ALRSECRLVEVPFQFERPGDVTSGHRPLLLSGIIDLAFRESGGWVLVDYKTDSAPASQLSELIDHYRPQAEAYATAWRELIGEPVQEMALYFTQAARYVTLQ